MRGIFFFFSFSSQMVDESSQTEGSETNKRTVKSVDYSITTGLPVGRAETSRKQKEHGVANNK
jgi:hypothetical protein